jgi:hypothetical protein
MQGSPTWEDNSQSASQEILHLLQNVKVYFHVHKTPLLASTWARCIHSTTSHPITLRSILILSLHLRLDFQVVPSFKVFRQEFSMPIQ